MVGFSGSTRPYLYPYPIIITLPYPYVKLPYPGGPYPTPGDPTSGRTYVGSPRGGPYPPRRRVGSKILLPVSTLRSA